MSERKRMTREEKMEIVVKMIELFPEEIYMQDVNDIIKILVVSVLKAEPIEEK